MKKKPIAQPRANPADRHHPANAIVVHVLRSTWPCKNSKGATSL